MKLPLLVLAISLLGGCAVSLKPPPAIPEEYLTLCKPPGALTGGDHQTVEIWAITTASDARRCLETHGKLVDAVKRREAVYK